MFSILPYLKIVISKGDTATILVDITDLDDKSFKIENDDVITFTVFREDLGIVFQKETETIDGKQYFILTSEQTEITPGLYSYEVTLERNGNQYTIIQPSIFEVKGEVLE